MFKWLSLCLKAFKLMVYQSLALLFKVGNQQISKGETFRNHQNEISNTMMGDLNMQKVWLVKKTFVGGSISKVFVASCQQMKKQTFCFYLRMKSTCQNPRQKKLI